MKAVKIFDWVHWSRSRAYHWWLLGWRKRYGPQVSFFTAFYLQQSAQKRTDQSFLDRTGSVQPILSMQSLSCVARVFFDLNTIRPTDLWASLVERTGDCLGTIQRRRDLMFRVSEAVQVSIPYEQRLAKHCHQCFLISSHTSPTLRCCSLQCVLDTYCWPLEPYSTVKSGFLMRVGL